MTAANLIDDLASRGVRLWAESDRLKFEAPRGALTDDDKAMLAEHKPALLELLTSGHLCPGCAGEMVLQDRAADAWYCPNCRRWTDGKGRPLPKIEKPKPVTRDADDARRLIADLRGAGCVFVIEDGELRLKYPSRMSFGLWTRFESAGDVFRSMAFEAAIDDAMPEDANEWLH